MKTPEKVMVLTLLISLLPSVFIFGYWSIPQARRVPINVNIARYVNSIHCTETIFIQCEIFNSYFERCDIKESNLRTTIVKNSILTYCLLQSCYIINCTLNSCTIDNATITK